MFKRKPKNKKKKNLINNSNDSQNSDIESKNEVEDSYLPFVSEELAYNIFEKTEGYTVEEILKEYRHLNEVFVEVMNRLSYIYVNFEYDEDDIVFLKTVKYNYCKRSINHKESRFFQSDIHKNILQATFRDTIFEIQAFFGETDEDWEYCVNKYRTDAFKISDKYFSLFIFHVDKLYYCLKELERDYYNDKIELFDNLYSFSEVMKGIQGLDLEEQRQSVTRTMAEFTELCLKDDNKTIDKKYEEEFLQKCQKLVNLIDFQRQNGISINPTFEEIEKWQNDFEDRDKTNDAIPETDITLNRQFLALYYMLNELDSKIFSRNKSEIARFIQLLTGKNYDNIYKLTKNPLKDPSDRTSAKYQTDIQFIKEKFLKLGLENIARKIENDNLVG